MQENSRRLIDEALADEPIKNTLRLTREFMTLNKNFTLTALSLLLLLNLLSVFLGFLAIIVSGILSMAIQIYVGRVVYESENIASFLKKTKESKLETLLPIHLSTASGAYFGTLTIFFVVLLLIGFMLSSMSPNIEGMPMEKLLELMQVFLLPTLVGLLLVSYFYPLVQSNITLSKDFKEGYRSVFTLFTPELWQKTFRKDYFKYVVSILFLVIFAAVALVSFVSLPFVSLLANFIVIVAMYLYLVFSAVVAMMARRMVEQEI